MVTEAPTPVFDFTPERAREARQNMEAFSLIDYHGRVVILGRLSDGRLAALYALSSRSERNKNRLLVVKNGQLWTDVADPSKEKGDPSLTIYPAVIRTEDGLASSNGEHTNAIATGYRIGARIEYSLSSYSYEPDQPLYTSRIGGLSSSTQLVMANVRRGSAGETLRDYFRYSSPQPGFGMGMHTYDGTGSGQGKNGTDPIHFNRNPYILPFDGSPEGIAYSYWDAMNPEHRIALAVGVFIPGSRDLRFWIINQRGEQPIHYLRP